MYRFYAHRTAQELQHHKTYLHMLLCSVKQPMHYGLEPEVLDHILCCLDASLDLQVKLHGKSAPDRVDDAFAALTYI